MTESWGGSRPGAGRPKGRACVNRIAIWLTDDVREGLRKMAKERGIPDGRLAREIIEKEVRKENAKAAGREAVQ